MHDLDLRLKKKTSEILDVSVDVNPGIVATAVLASTTPDRNNHAALTAV